MTAGLDARGPGLGESPGTVVAVTSSPLTKTSGRKQGQPLTWGSAPVIGGPPDVPAPCVAPAHKALHHGVEIGTYRNA